MVGIVGSQPRVRPSGFWPPARIRTTFSFSCACLGRGAELQGSRRDPPDRVGTLKIGSEAKIGAGKR